MFDGLLSNNRMKNELERSLTAGRSLQAYMFCGADGSGKLTAAKMLARELVGVNPDKVDRDAHPDVIIIRPEKDKKTIPVERIRIMRADAFISPTEGVRKIYIIDGAHFLNDSGQNALLTILEQPPSFAVFILLTESREKMLSTVVSRCAVFEMEYVDASEGARFLSKQLPDIKIDKLIAAMHASQGNIGLAKMLAQGDVLESAGKTCEKIMLAAADKDEYALAKMLMPLAKDRLIGLLPVLSMYIRDITVYRCMRDQNQLAFKQSVLQNASSFDKINMDLLYEGVMECENAQALIDASVNAQLVCARLIIILCGGKIN